MADIVAAFLWALAEVVLAYTGKAVIWSLSFGRWRSESLREDESRAFAAAGALSFVRDGQRVITTTGIVFAGLAFYVLFGVILLAYATEA
jgi:fatty acid desaturase